MRLTGIVDDKATCLLYLSQVTRFVKRVQLNFFFIIIGKRNQTYPINCTIIF